METPRKVVAFHVKPEALQGALEILHTMPYWQVAEVVQALTASEPVFAAPLGEPDPADPENLPH